MICISPVMVWEKKGEGMVEYSTLGGSLTLSPPHLHLCGDALWNEPLYSDPGDQGTNLYELYPTPFLTGDLEQVELWIGVLHICRKSLLPPISSENTPSRWTDHRDPGGTRVGVICDHC